MTKSKSKCSSLSKLSLSIKRTLSCCVTFGLATSFIHAAEEDIERIAVVGSHIKRVDIEGASPVTVVTREEIKNSGVGSVQEIMRKLPSIGTGSFSAIGDSNDGTSVGQAGASLRGLGVDSTLVLINGRRAAISSFANKITNSFVDLNSIPLAAVERIEVLKDGASATYGSDAIAGVINVVTRKDYEGVEISANYGDTTESDASEQKMSFAFGVGSDSTHVTMVFDYYDRNGTLLADRDYSKSADQTANGGFDQRSSSGNPGTAILPDGESSKLEADSACPAESITVDSSGNRCRYDYAPFISSVPEAERFGTMLFANHDLTPSVNLFAEMQYQINQGAVSGAASPSFGEFIVPASHPDNPYGIDVPINFRFTEAGNRFETFEHENLRMLVGAKGLLLNQFDWEVGYAAARNDSTQDGINGFVRADNIQSALDNGSLNPFGGATNSSSVIDSISTLTYREAESKLDMLDFKLSGDIAEFSDALFAMAVGFEYREEEIEDRPDELYTQGLIVGTEATAAQAERDQYSAFVEMVGDFNNQVTVQLALRYEDYSDFGTDTNPKLAVRWQPLEDLVLRSSIGTAFRAPSLVQLGLGLTQESPTLFDNARCSQLLAAVAAGDLQEGVIADDPACNPTEYTTQVEGNPDLQPEESTNFGLGLAWEVMSNASVTLDYWNYDIENVIDFDTQNRFDEFASNSSVVFREPVNPTELAAGVTLGVVNSQLGMLDTFFNINEQKTDGLDVNLDYNFDYAGIGEFRWLTSWTHVLSFEQNGVDINGDYRRPENRWFTLLDWQQDVFAATTRINYIGEYLDNVEVNGSIPTIDAMTTVDFQLRYLGFNKATITLGADNIFDEEPPFSFAEFQGYDFETHSPRGQFIYLSYTQEL